MIVQSMIQSIYRQTSLKVLNFTTLNQCKGYCTVQETDSIKINHFLQVLHNFASYYSSLMSNTGTGSSSSLTFPLHYPSVISTFSHLSIH